jgi:hypothetical protein
VFSSLDDVSFAREDRLTGIESCGVAICAREPEKQADNNNALLISTTDHSRMPLSMSLRA